MDKMLNELPGGRGGLLLLQDDRILPVHSHLALLRTTPKHRNGSRLQYLLFRLEMVLHHAQDLPMALPAKEYRLQYRSRTLLRRYQSAVRPTKPTDLLLVLYQIA